MAWFDEKLVVLGAAFAGPRFAAAWSFWNRIAGDDGEHLLDQLLLAPWPAGRRVDGIGEVPGRVERAFETQAAQDDGVLVRGALHEDAHQVVGYQVHGDFPLDHGRALAAQVVRALALGQNSGLAGPAEAELTPPTVRAPQISCMSLTGASRKSSN